MILRIYKPDEGRVVVLGNDHGDAADERLGWISPKNGALQTNDGPPRASLLRHGSRDFAAPIRGSPSCFKQLGAAEYEKKKIEQLSKGMAQKIQFISAVVARPKLVILMNLSVGLIRSIWKSFATR